MVGNNAVEIAKVINKAYELWRQGKLFSSFDLSPIEEFTWESRARTLAEALAELM